MFAITFILIIFFCKMEIINFLSTKQYELKDIKKKYNKNNKLKKIDEKYFPVKCHNGIFLGKENEDIISYKGIPFARPPIKNLRWKPPLDCEDSDNIFEAYHFQKSPIQSETPGEDASYYEISEDCLYLNIWKYNDEQKNKPVMVFIHGGDFGWGGTVDPLYDGHNFVKNHNDIILVTITYRLSILGFLDLTLIKGGEDYKESPNLGLLDQIQALKWINKNIENFGGDKNNVTIFGESAGGSSVTLLPLINGTKGLFKRIISQSGSFAWTINKEAGKKVIDNLKAIIKKEGKEEFDINYLLNLSEEEIIKLNIQFDSYRKSPMRDGFILPEDCYEAVKNGAYNGIDIMIGSNADELRYWIIEMGNFFFLKIFLKTLAENIIVYRIKKNGLYLFKKFKKIVKKNTDENFLNDLFFRMPALKLAQLHSENNGNVYLYYWTYPSSIPFYGACHSVELPYIFNNLKAGNLIGDKHINYKLAEISQNMWTNFAKNGNPSTNNYIWKKYDSKNKYYMNFGNEPELKIYSFSEERDKIIEPLLYEYIPTDYGNLSLNIPFMRRIFIILVSIIIIILSLVI